MGLFLMGDAEELTVLIHATAKLDMADTVGRYR